MALISIIEDFHPLNDAKLLYRADELKPSLHHEIVEPVGGFQLKERYSPEREEIVLQKVPKLAMGKGQNLCLDFGDHYVGYLTLEFSYTGSHPDAPAFLKLKFSEVFDELSENSDDYDGWISRSWIQEEYIHVDVLPARVTLPRRYAFRYLKITMMDTSPKYKLIVKHAELLTESSANYKRLEPFTTGDELKDRIYNVGIRTLANCMQDVFEDGPKRDQRLWMGDLRLEALANYVSFRNMNLVRRCLYLFGGSRFPDGRISANVFIKPAVEADDTWMFDYSLLFVVALEEYLQETNDEETLNDLYDIAMQQVEISLRHCDERHVVDDEAANSAFIDWREGMDKHGCAQAVLIFAMRYARRLARRKNDFSQANWLLEQLELLRKAAIEYFWDEEQKCFVSEGQAAIATQVWMVLADVLEPEKARELMENSERFLTPYKMATPYMHHYYVTALCRTGLLEKAEKHMKEYWGSMLDAGADTFWEAWDPDDPKASPYGGKVINSYCHAWSCSPVVLIKKFFNQQK